ncbi:hypothetical protein GQ457_12G032690 [Hibiscus cannabinus]
MSALLDLSRRTESNATNGDLIGVQTSSEIAVKVWPTLPETLFAGVSPEKTILFTGVPPEKTTGNTVHNKNFQYFCKLQFCPSSFSKNYSFTPIVEFQPRSVNSTFFDRSGHNGELYF